MNKYIIDVGTSYNAPKGIYLKQKYKCPVIFIEPDKDALDKVPCQKDDIKLNIAITSYDGEIEFKYYQTGTHSVLDTNINDIHKYIDGFTGKRADIKKWTAWKKEKVECLRLETVINKYSIDLIPYLKIDTQGHDFEVIKSLGNKIKIVNQIECEVQVTSFEIYKNQSKKEEVIQFMRENKFILEKTISQTYGQEQNLIFKKENG